VLAVTARVLGEEHPDTLTSTDELALTLSKQGDHAGAQRLQEQVLEMRTRLLGKEHRDTLTSRGNLAWSLLAQGDHEGAQELLEPVLEVLKSKDNLAWSLLAQGDHAGALGLLEQVLEVRTHVFGPEHPHTSISAWNLFRTLRDLGELPSGLAVLERDLLWLLDRDPSTLGADQRTVRVYVALAIKENG
jgi:tetratricopeptide (TPR) repeat protein